MWEMSAVLGNPEDEFCCEAQFTHGSRHTCSKEEGDVNDGTQRL